MEALMRMPGRLLAVCATIFMIGCGSGAPLIELYEDGTLRLDGDRIELADLSELSERPADAPTIRLRIHGDTPVKHVWAVQSQLQEAGIENVVVVDD
jgi:biopolymer transport protein ExbD